MFDLAELQRKLEESRNEISPCKKIRIRTAAVDHHHDATEVLELGVNPGEVSVLLGMPEGKKESNRTKEGKTYSHKGKYSEYMMD